MNSPIPDISFGSGFTELEVGNFLSRAYFQAARRNIGGILLNKADIKRVVSLIPTNPRSSLNLDQKWIRAVAAIYKRYDYYSQTIPSYLARADDSVPYLAIELTPELLMDGQHSRQYFQWSFLNSVDAIVNAEVSKTLRDQMRTHLARALHRILAALLHSLLRQLTRLSSPKTTLLREATWHFFHGNMPPNALRSAECLFSY